MTALALHGHSHYLPLAGKASVWVYGMDIPNWLRKLPLNADLKTRNLSLFADQGFGLSTQNLEPSVSAPAALPWDWKLLMSSPERAILEAVDELPAQTTFHNVDMVFEGLTTLRPKVLSALLHSCRKIKTTRLFFVFADRHDHPWRRRLDLNDFKLGTGDCAMVKRGKIHPRYRIIVPEEFTETETDNDA